MALFRQTLDRTFSVESLLNRNTFEEGDAAELTVRTKRSAWVYIFNLMADDRVIWLFPNRYQQDHQVRPGTPLTFPAPGCGVCLQMAPLAGEPESAEAFLVIAFPERQPIGDQLESNQPYGLPEFYQRLVRFPLETAAMDLVPYVVRAKQQGR